MKKDSVDVGNHSMSNNVRNNYFSLFELEQAFSIDLEKLEKQYFSLQRLYHPDRFIQKSNDEKMAALQKAADINEGYEILKCPIRRIKHMLALETIEVDAERSDYKPNPQILMESKSNKKP